MSRNILDTLNILTSRKNSETRVLVFRLAHKESQENQSHLIEIIALDAELVDVRPLVLSYLSKNTLFESKPFIKYETSL